ncbi:MAG: hypothetical protein R2939_22565 [Kofleriaceae bacterium]
MRPVRLALGALVVVALGGCDDCKVGYGESCDDDGDCRHGVCVAGRCGLSPGRERELVAASGVEVPAESPASAPLPGLPVRVRETYGEHRLFAACGPRERLVGGGCAGGEGCETCPPTSSWPSGQQADDTVGARWNCQGRGSLRAYALCQAIAPSGPTPDARLGDAGAADDVLRALGLAGADAAR